MGRPCRWCGHSRPCARDARRAACSGKPSSVRPTQAWLPAVGGVPATAEGPLRVGCPRQSGLPPGWLDYGWRFSQHGSLGAGGCPPAKVPPPQQARRWGWGARRRPGRCKLGGLPPSGAPSSVGHADRCGWPQRGLPAGVVHFIRCWLSGGSGRTAGTAGGSCHPPSMESVRSVTADRK